MSTISADLLTAYALGEASPADQALVEQHLATSPTARAEVEAIRAAAALLSSSLAGETSPGLDRQRRLALAALPGAATTRRRIAFPHRIVWPGALAACLVVGVMSLSRSAAPTNPQSAATAMLARKEEAPAPAVLRDRSASHAAPADVAPAPVAEPVMAMQVATEQATAPAAAAMPTQAASDEPVLAMADRQSEAKVAKSTRAEAEADVIVAERLDAKPAAPAPAAAPLANAVTSPAAAVSKADTRAKAPAGPAEAGGAALMLGAVTPTTGAVSDLRAHLAAGTWPPPATIQVDELLAAFVPQQPADETRGKDAALPSDADRQRFAGAVVEFAGILRGTRGPASLEHVLQVATATSAGRPERLDFISLVRQAQQILARPPAAAAAPAAASEHQ